jgi:hypothetical protein
MLPLALASLLVLGLAGQAVAAQPTTSPSYGATMKASRDCLLTVTATWKNATVGGIDLGWYEVGYQDPSYPGIPEWLATSQWPSTSPNTGVQKGKSVIFSLGPVGADSVAHEWYALVTFRGPGGEFLTQVRTSNLTTNCYVPSPA